MLGNFSYHNPTKLYFGDDSLKYLAKELENYGNTVMLCYGGGSIKRNGVYDAVTAILRETGKTVVEDPGVMPNPTVDKLYEGARLARENNVDLILAVGGGSTCDYSKAVSVSAYCEKDPWATYYLAQREPKCRIIPVGCVLTMAGTGSEMNAGSVITHPAQKLKIGKVFGPEVMPRFTILNPRFTFSLPKYQVVAGVYDIFNHICEQYFSGEDDCTSDYIAEGLMRSVVNSSRDAVEDLENYEARSNIMWTATWALNTLISRGKTTDWMVHMLGQAVGAYTNATHGHTLAAVSLPYYRTQLDAGLHKFARWAKVVWDVNPEGKTERETALEGLERMKQWMEQLGLTMNITDLGATPDMIEGIASATFLLKGGYKPLTREDVINVLNESL